MSHLPAAQQPIDYLVVGHVAQDLDPDGHRHLGGTASFAASMARALGLRVGIVTAAGPEAELAALDGVALVCHAAPESTTFENRYTASGRVQHLYSHATALNVASIPAGWLNTPIVHLGPIAREVDPAIVKHLGGGFVGLTLQGWLRQWDSAGRVSFYEWPPAQDVLATVQAAVFSIEDVEHDWALVERWAAAPTTLVVTQAAEGATIFAQGVRQHLAAPHVTEVDPTGAGDLFAAAYFIRLRQTGDPWAAGRFAVSLASASVTRPGLDGIPTAAEIATALVQDVAAGG